MKIFSVGLSGAIWWRVPEAWEGHEFPDLGVRLCTPLLQASPHPLDRGRALRMGGELLVVSHALVLAVADVRQVRDAATRVLDRLRFASGQVSIPRLWETITGPADARRVQRGEVDEAPSGLRVNQTYAQRAVTPSMCEVASREEPSPPFLFLMDAAESVLRYDARRAILYAAIAAESMSRLRLDELAENAAQHRRPDPALRFRESPDGETWRDAVYEQLRRDARFLPLLHEVPLYLIGRSIRLESPDLYQEAQALYKARNKLVHEAAAPEGPAFLPTSLDGARRALGCAVRVFEWWGTSAERFLIPEDGLV